ncbi:related to Tyrosine-protein phosphatase-like protein OCA2 [Hanseniaspora guilliermondii]|uniref:Related to Tyrosine-protein phosphatase-like protein OCA2 n=1 Tax=Hanseniaspora guilliermondii TaxID=56406 RepID=A0A1L0CS70_9ASCO|nr:related to Tyrosine-protein phosphatase-like protein OCA2 [Hanseniaspora guilliermondii]
MNPYIPPLNLGMVINSSKDNNEVIYRSGFPQPLNYPYIEETLNLKTIIYIGSEKSVTDEYKAFITKNNYIFKIFEMSSVRDENLHLKIKHIFELILNKQNYPILIHSNKGKHRIGVITGLIRKVLLGWSISGIYQEYGVYTGNIKGEMDLEFINNFDFGDLNVDFDIDQLPSYLNYV